MNLPERFEKALLVRYAEIHLKGLNRPFFEKQLVNAIKKAVSHIPAARVVRAQSRIYVYDIPEEMLEDAIGRLQRVFGIHSVSPALCVDTNWQSVMEAAVALMEEQVAGRERVGFKVLARRADKQFPMRSDEINRKLGEILLETYPNLYVDVHQPEIKVGVEIRERAYVYAGAFAGQGGMPVGCNGRALLLISGGIDSPVAGYMIAKRGVSLSAVHYYSYPYTSERARDKVVELTGIVSRYAGPIKLHLVPFTDIQLAIYEKCPSSETTVLMRRLMMRIAEKIAVEDRALAIVTGEAIGQVASQTMESLRATDDVVEMPVFRPLIGFDKSEIIERAQQIGTFETSILPYEDCCTVFVPQHPVTKPNLEKIRKSEGAVDFTELIAAALNDREILMIEQAD